MSVLWSEEYAYLEQNCYVDRKRCGNDTLVDNLSWNEFYQNLINTKTSMFEIKCKAKYENIKYSAHFMIHIVNLYLQLFLIFPYSLK